MICHTTLHTMVERHRLPKTWPEQLHSLEVPVIQALADDLMLQLARLLPRAKGIPNNEASYRFLETFIGVWAE